MIRWLILSLAFLALSPPALAVPSQPPVTVRITRGADGRWTADYRFGERATAWMFPRSNPDLDGRPWRQRSWVVETAGVRLERLGRYDALVADRGVPRRVRIRFEPSGEPLRADYTPALKFSDGGIALYTDHFLVAPQPSAKAVAALGFELGDLVERPTTLVVRAPGRRMLVRGEAASGEVRIAPDRTGTYVYVGDTPVIATPTFAGVLDPGLPEWIRTELDMFLPRLLSYYADRLGKPAGARPMAMVSWGGGAAAGSSLGGSVLDGMVVMDLSGRQVAARSAAILDRLRWFFGHESAHFWLGHTVRYESKDGAWITEGSADLLAIRALGVLSPGYDQLREVQRELDDCLKVNGRQPLAGASERGEIRANYACGAILLLAAEGAERKRAPSADAATFARRLIDGNRADGIVSQADWLAAFGMVSDAALAGRMRTFLIEGSADPTAFFADLFTATGVAFERRDGKLVLL